MKKSLMGLAVAVAVMPFYAQANYYGRSAYNATPTMYLFGGVGAADYDLASEDVRFSFGDGSLNRIEEDNQSVSWRFGVGYRIADVLSFEFGYVNLGEFAASAQSDGSRVATNGYAPGRVDIDGESSGVFLGLNAHTPDEEPVGLYLRGGIYSWEVDGRVADSSRSGRFLVDGVDPFIGGGLRFAIDRNIQIQVGYDYYFIDDDEALDTAVGVLGADLVFYF